MTSTVHRFPHYDPASHYDLRIFDVEFRRDGDEVWMARVYQPEGQGPFPAMLDVHGGAWTDDNRMGNALVDEVLAASGVMIVAIDLRSAPKHVYPALVADVNLGIRWLKAHAADFNAVPDHIGAFGSSSGGHLVELAGMRPFDPRYCVLPLPDHEDVDATIDYLIGRGPISAPDLRNEYARQIGREYLAERTMRFFDPPETIREGNPLYILERGESVHLPPFLILQGGADTNILESVQARFVAAYRAAGGEVQYEVFPGVPHKFIVDPGPEQDRAFEVAKAFIAQQVTAPAPAR
jgi:acetyl esterase/lipase